MSRVKRLLVTGRIVFVTINVRKDRPKLAADEYPLMIAALEDSRRRLSFRLCGYVLMPDHWHALIGVDPPLTISRAIQDIKWVAARRIGRQRNAGGSFWQHQFWDRFVLDGKEFGERLAYMHLNPVKKRVVERPEAWRWSSYNNFALDSAIVARCPIQIDYSDV
jgi:putative transposase